MIDFQMNFYVKKKKKKKACFYKQVLRTPLQEMNVKTT